MGNVKTEQVKRVGKELMARFPDKFSRDFDGNKRAVNAYTEGTTKTVRNQIAGYITRALALAEAHSGKQVDEEETAD